jgi:orotidine-5'-phosphate decarboxylase
VVNRIIAALDFPALDDAEEMATSLIDDVGGFKVGMELLMAAGPIAIETIAGLGRPVFVDAKLHDIPNTVRRAAAEINAAGARWVTVHAAGGREMIEAASEGMGGDGVLAVTVLTSLGQGDLAEIGVAADTMTHVTNLAALGKAAGAEGIVCSPGEIAAVKQSQPGLKVFTPGVRPEGSSSDDQKRVATPERARADGADYLVIGRPITAAGHPVEVAREIAAAIATFD